ncbi:hypothetical protein EXIGLDRAFT_830427 [Exidia glandulosa HHB12029]|uniref:F-box domain-containing protein n=1 Tax=Exidia glandulosa HHB12029 TaxID=1314781 RepID=A0A165NP64_EXIGL|nr:hypothetical protein EXIGLDRAFT_830427 [Exidia glandulosa HHB12029]
MVSTSRRRLSRPLLVSPMSLLVLPDETLTHIACLLQKEGRRPVADVRQLALASTRLNRACSPVLWRKYVFVIRSFGRDIYGSEYTERGIPEGSEQWLMRFDRRIAHLHAKAPYIRDLTVLDSPSDSYSGVPPSLPFNAQFLDRAMPTICACMGLTKLSVFNYCTENISVWPAQLWCLVQNALPRLQELYLAANFTEIPRLEGALRRLTALKLRWCSSLIDDLLPQKMLLPRTLELDFVEHDASPPPANQRFVVPDLVGQQLDMLKVTMPHFRVPGPVFDVAPLAHVEIYIEVYFACDFKAHRPPAWRRIKPELKSLVTDDIRSYDVRKNYEVYITRPSLVEFPDYKGVYQDQVRDVAIDDAEQAEMDAFYRSRKASRMGWC